MRPVAAKISYPILQAIRDMLMAMKPDTYYGEATNLARGRHGAKVASRNYQAAQRGLRKLEGEP